MFFNITFVDWLHHILMIGIVLPFGLIYKKTAGSVINYCCFFLSGLPGCVDYIMLFFVKRKLLDKITEKKINSYINIWIRGPFLIIGSYIIYLNCYYKNYNPTTMLVSMLLFWNAQYFSKRIVGNYYSNI